LPNSPTGSTGPARSARGHLWRSGGGAGMGCPLVLAARLLNSGDANSVPGATRTLSLAPSPARASGPRRLLLTRRGQWWAAWATETPPSPARGDQRRAPDGGRGEFPVASSLKRWRSRAGPPRGAPAARAAQVRLRGTARTVGRVGPTRMPSLLHPTQTPLFLASTGGDRRTKELL
jgi:hypothetical protein